MQPFHVNTRLATPQDNTYDESLFELATEQPQALIWQGTNGLVVPRTYAQQPLFASCQQQLQNQGWPIHIRQSGGGVVPQGPGIWNVSLAWRQYGKPLDLSDSAYQLLYTPIQQALRTCGVESSPQAVHGSFCDGRFNLAVEHQGLMKKIVGTAQVWRRCAPPLLNYTTPTRKPGSPADWHIVLAHALLLIQADTALLSQRANEVEKHLGRSQRYQAQRICTLNQLHVSPSEFLLALQTELAAIQTPRGGYPPKP